MKEHKNVTEFSKFGALYLLSFPKLGSTTSVLKNNNNNNKRVHFIPHENVTYELPVTVCLTLLMMKKTFLRSILEHYLLLSHQILEQKNQLGHCENISMGFFLF